MKQSRKRPKQRRKIVQIVEGVILITVFLVMVIYLGVKIFVHPDKVMMDSDPEIVETVSSTQAETDENALMFAENKVVYGGKTYRRNTYVKAILCIGIDRTGSLEESTVTGAGGQADGVFLTVQDTARNNLKIMMIPRDTMTKIPLTDLSGNLLGYDTQHLTLAYAYGDGREQSCEYMTESVSNLLLGLPIDHYFAANIETIVTANDLVGGVTVTVPSDDMVKAYPELTKGTTVTLHGDMAERFIRYRDTSKSNTALFRMDRQQEYIAKFYETLRVQSAVDSGIVTRLFDAVTDHMVTDMSKDEYMKIALDALESGSFSGESIYTLPGQGVQAQFFDEFYPDEEGMIQLVLDLFYREET